MASPSKLPSAAHRVRTLACVLSVALLVAACGGLVAPRSPSGPAPTQPPGSTTSPSPGRAPSTGAPSSTAPSSPAPSSPAPEARGAAPIPDRPINIKGACAQTEEDGFREQATLDVQDNQVRSLAWQLWVGKRGSCRFAQSDFRQTKSRPHIELLATDGSGCKLMVWQDPRRITLAHAGCEQRCTRGIYDEAWPVMFDPATGGCGRLN